MNIFKKKKEYLFKRDFFNAGFTLIELIVSLSIFVVVMVVVMGSILSVLDLNSKIQSKKTAMDNLNFSLETMSRTIKFGTEYHCGSSGVLTSPNDCTSGSGNDPSLTVTSADGIPVTYALIGTQLTQTIAGNSLALTSSEVIIQKVTFYVIGAPGYATDYLQPRVIIVVSAIAGSANKAKTQATFDMETTVSQRKLDI